MSKDGRRRWPARGTCATDLRQRRVPGPGLQDSFVAAQRAAGAKALAACLPDAKPHLLDGLGDAPIFTVLVAVSGLMDACFMQAMVAAA